MQISENTCFVNIDRPDMTDSSNRKITQNCYTSNCRMRYYNFIHKKITLTNSVGVRSESRFTDTALVIKANDTVVFADST